MSLKKFYYNKNIEICYTCKFIDEYAMNVADDGEEPFGYDGGAWCCMFDVNEPESNDNRDFISPLWKACKKYVRCTKRQAEYLDIYDEKKQRIVKNPNDISKIDKDYDKD